MGLRFQVLTTDFPHCGGLSPVPVSPVLEPTPVNAVDAGFSLHDLKARQHYCLASSFVMPETPEQNQLLFFSALAAAELFLDGVKVGRNGKPAQHADEEMPGTIDYNLTLRPEQLQKGRHQLVLKLSTYHGSERVKNPFYRLSIDDQLDMHGANNRAILLPLLLTGALLLISILFSGLTLFYQRQAHWILFLFLSLVASGLLLVEVWRSLFAYLYPFHLIRLYLVQVLTWFFSILLPVYFLVYYRFQHVPLTAFVLMLTTVSVTFLSPYFDAKSTMMFGVALLSSFVINLIAYRHKKSGSKVGLFIVMISFGLFLIPVLRFAETGFALIVCFLQFTILWQLVQQFARDKEKAALATQLENQLLRRSLQPHFLMNSLSLVGELLHQSPQKAETFIQALGREFRMLNEYANSPRIALMQELELCQNYLEIMSVRLQKDCSLQIEGEATGIAIPPAILLTVLENAFSHNKYRQETQFDLHIVRDAQFVYITLQLPIVSPRVHLGTGTGNQYIRQSLHEVFDGRATYATEQRDEIWYARFQFPVSLI